MKALSSSTRAKGFASDFRPTVFKIGGKPDFSSLFITGKIRSQLKGVNGFALVEQTATMD
jgi:hypothetical protein